MLAHVLSLELWRGQLGLHHCQSQAVEVLLAFPGVEAQREGGGQLAFQRLESPDLGRETEAVSRHPVEHLS